MCTCSFTKKASWLVILKAKDPARFTACTKFYDRDKPNDWTSARSWSGQVVTAPQFTPVWIFLFKKVSPHWSYLNFFTPFLLYLIICLIRSPFSAHFFTLISKDKKKYNSKSLTPIWIFWCLIRKPYSLWILCYIALWAQIGKVLFGVIRGFCVKDIFSYRKLSKFSENVHLFFLRPIDFEISGSKVSIKKQGG